MTLSFEITEQDTARPLYALRRQPGADW